MKSNDKIYVAEYLNYLNDCVKYEYTYNHIKKNSIKTLTCKELAEKVGVTPATITNLNTNSKFYLIFRIAEEIFDTYYEHFLYEEKATKKDYPDETIYARNKEYVLMCLTTYYTETFLNL